jgi:hypothetical protein
MSKTAEYLDLLFYTAKCRGLCPLNVSVGSMCYVLFDCVCSTVWREISVMLVRRLQNSCWSTLHLNYKHLQNQKYVATDDSLLERDVTRRAAGNMKQRQRRFAAALNLTALRLFATATPAVHSQCQRYEKRLWNYTRYRRIVPVIRSVKLDAA